MAEHESASSMRYLLRLKWQIVELKGGYLISKGGDLRRKKVKIHLALAVKRQDGVVLFNQSEALNICFLLIPVALKTERILFLKFPVRDLYPK